MTTQQPLFRASIVLPLIFFHPEIAVWLVEKRLAVSMPDWIGGVKGSGKLHALRTIIARVTKKRTQNKEEKKLHAVLREK